jgi:hypothetical protein
LRKRIAVLRYRSGTDFCRLEFEAHQLSLRVRLGGRGNLVPTPTHPCHPGPGPGIHCLERKGGAFFSPPWDSCIFFFKILSY